MSKNYISVEHAIRNIVNEPELKENIGVKLIWDGVKWVVKKSADDAAEAAGKVIKKDKIELPPLKMEPAPTGNLPAKIKKPASDVPLEGEILPPVKKQSITKPKQKEPVVIDMPSTKPTVQPKKQTQTAPIILPQTQTAPATQTQTQTQTKPQTQTQTQTKPQTKPGTPTLPPTDSKPKRKRKIFGGFGGGLTPGQDTGVFANSEVPVKTYMHMAKERMTFGEEKTTRTEIENVARPNTERQKVMSRNESIKKQIIDETNRRKITIKDSINNYSRGKDKNTVNLKPETNDEPNELVNEQNVKWKPSASQDLRSGAFKTMKPEEIAKKLNDPYWKDKLAPHIENLKDFERYGYNPKGGTKINLPPEQPKVQTSQKPINPTDIDTSQVKRDSSTTFKREGTTINPKTGKPTSSIKDIAKSLGKGALRLLTVPLAVGTELIGQGFSGGMISPAGEGSERKPEAKIPTQAEINKVEKEIKDKQTTSVSAPASPPAPVPATQTPKTDVAAWSPSTPRPWAAGLDKMGDVKASAAQEVKQQKAEKAETSKAALPTNKIVNALQQKREKTKKVTPEVKQQSPKSVGNFTGGFGQTATYGVNQPGAFKRGGLYDTRGR